MRRSVGPLLIVSAILAAGLVGLTVGRSNGPLPEWLSALAVRGSEDVSFEEKAPEAKVAEAMAPEAKAPKVMAAKSGGTHRVKYYRNPMGLPDKSDTPKKDNMGIAYLPVYEDDQDDDSSVKVSAGKLQKTGVQTEISERRTLNTMVRAPGTVEEDERRRSSCHRGMLGVADR